MDATFWLVLLLSSFVLGVILSGFGREPRRRLVRIERKVDLIVAHLGLDPNQGVNPEVMERVKAGRKIEAIKLYRAQTGAGLKEAKDYVESL